MKVKKEDITTDDLTIYRCDKIAQSIFNNSFNDYDIKDVANCINDLIIICITHKIINAEKIEFIDSLIKPKVSVKKEKEVFNIE